MPKSAKISVNRTRMAQTSCEGSSLVTRVVSRAMTQRSSSSLHSGRACNLHNWHDGKLALQHDNVPTQRVGNAQISRCNNTIVPFQYPYTPSLGPLQLPCIPEVTNAHATQILSIFKQCNLEYLLMKVTVCTCCGHYCAAF